MRDGGLRTESILKQSQVKQFQGFSPGWGFSPGCFSAGYQLKGRHIGYPDKRFFVPFRYWDPRWKNTTERRPVSQYTSIFTFPSRSWASPLVLGRSLKGTRRIMVDTDRSKSAPGSLVMSRPTIGLPSAASTLSRTRRS